jgi:hypothetical protein
MIRRLCAGVVSSLAIGSTATAQEPRALPGPAARLAHGFTRISAVRELADGRTLVADAGDRRLYVADWTTGAVTQVGREGQGPAEYSGLGALFPLAADSTLLVDVVGSRYLVLLGDSIVETVSSGSPAHLAGARAPIGAGGPGWVITTRSMGSSPKPSPAAMPARMDSVHLVRVHRVRGTSDTLVTIMARPSRITFRGPREAPTAIEVSSNPLAAGDAAVMWPDGWIAVARQSPYGVDWISPAQGVVKGNAIPFERRRLAEADKRGAMQRMAAARGREPADPASRDDWPELLPPFLPGAVVAAADGRAWIRRAPEPGIRETVYDIVDREGRRVSRVTVGSATQVIAVAGLAAYVVMTDDDGLQFLQRHPLPR